MRGGVAKGGLHDDDKERSDGIDVNEGVFDRLVLPDVIVVGRGAASTSKTHWLKRNMAIAATIISSMDTAVN